MLISSITASGLAIAEKKQVRCDLLDRIDAPIWFYDFDKYSIVWANRAALAIWNAETSAELAARDLRSEMSKAVAERLEQIREDLDRDAQKTFKEVWTFYPTSGPTAVECIFHHGGLAPARNCTMITGRLVAELRQDADMIRALDAILHSRTIAGLYTMDGDRLFINRALRGAIGSAASIGRFGNTFANPAQRDAFLTEVNAGRTWRDTVEVNTTKGPRWHDIEASPCKDAVSGDPAFHVSAMDVTETKLATEELREARNEARKANHAKSVFIANMSHEMRTPMNGVLGLLEVLRVSPLTPDQLELVRIAKESGVALLELIEDILDISSAELRAVSLETAPFNTEGVARQVVEGLASPASQKGLDLRLQICPELPAEAHGDRRRIAQVIRNLISNAIKYTDSGFIQLSLKRVGDALRVEVSDTGIGIPDDQKARIFERFYQPQKDQNMISDGLGLGLTIVKEIIDLWGGELTVEDSVDGGSSFAFTLPAAFPAKE